MANIQTQIRMEQCSTSVIIATARIDDSPRIPRPPHSARGDQSSHCAPLSWHRRRSRPAVAPITYLHSRKGFPLFLARDADALCDVVNELRLVLRQPAIRLFNTQHALNLYSRAGTHPNLAFRVWKLSRRARASLSFTLDGVLCTSVST